ncbi:MAG: type VI secretion system contractile sheath large subunit [Nannocystaceae bacterium]|nr:type VI secretion system contractile sheath large subunit [Nannocystaceae bacterium]
MSGERFATVMKRLGVDAAVMLPESLGDAALGPVPLQFTRPRTFRVEDVVEAVEPLRKLRDLAQALTKEQDLAPEVVRARVERIVGKGGLADRFQPKAPIQGDKPELPEPHEPEVHEPAAPAPALALDDDIFAMAELPGGSPQATAKSGLDAFVSAVRGSRAQTGVVDVQSRVDAAQQIRRTVAAAAASLLGQPVVARLEASWRGLRMLVASSPGHEDVGIDLVDVDPDNILEALERCVRHDDPHRPDAVFVGMATPPSTLEALTEFAAKLRVPIVVGVGRTLTGPAWREEDPFVSPDWSALRELEAADWLCGAANPVVLIHEETPAGPRLVLGSAAWGVASVLAAAVGRGGDLRSAMGPAGAVVAPAAHDVDLGFSEPRTIPTREYADVGALSRAADHGIVLLGSAPGSDQFLIGSGTMAGRGNLIRRIEDAARSR